MAPTYDIDTQFEILPRETIRAAIFILEKADAHIREAAWRTEDLLRVTGGVDYAQALLEDDTVLWPLIAKCDSSVDRHLWNLLRDARKWFAVLSEVSRSRFYDAYINRAFERVLTELPTYINNYADVDGQGVMTAKVDPILNFQNKAEKYVDYKMNSLELIRFVNVFDQQMIAAHWRRDASITQTPVDPQTPIQEMPATQGKGIPQSLTPEFCVARRSDGTHDAFRDDPVVAETTDDDETISVYTHTATRTSSLALMERPDLSCSSSAPYHTPSHVTNDQSDTDDVQVRYVAILETPNDKLSIEFEPTKDETTQLEVMMEKVKELHKWMKAQGCEDKFGLEELVGMARKMTMRE